MSNTTTNIDNNNSASSASLEKLKMDTFTISNKYSVVDAEEGKIQIHRESSLKKVNFKTSHVQPPGTLEYTVDKNDTIERIALKWNTVPSEILHINRLSNRMLYPGQVLFVPDPNYVPPPPPPPPAPAPQVKTPTSPRKFELPAASVDLTKQQTDRLSHVKWRNNTSPKPGHIERSHTISESSNIRAESIKKSPSKSSQHQLKEEQHHHLRHTLSEDEAKKLDEECMQRFLKLDSKLISYEKGNPIDGILLITPSALMFDPKIVNNNTNTNAEGGSTRRGSISSPADNESIIIPIEIISNVILYEDLSIKDVHNYIRKRHEEENEKTNNEDQSNKPDENNKNDEVKNENDLTLEFAKEQSESVVEQQKQSKEKLNDTNNNLTRTSNLSQSLTNLSTVSTKTTTTTTTITEATFKTPTISTSSLTSLNKDIRSSTSSLSKTSKTNLFELKDNKTEALRRHSINNIPNLFNEDDNTVLLCYLCIKVNTHKDFISCPMDRKMKNRLQSEFWFQVPDNSTDKICAFFLAWKFDPTFAMSAETPRGRFQLVKDDMNKSPKASDNDIENLKSSAKRILSQSDSFIKDWEVVNLTELENKLKAEEENEHLSLPKLIGETKLLTEDHLKLLNCNLIARAVSYDWILTFSTELHGFSLNTLYRQMNEVDSPCLIVVKDTNNNIFGAMTSCRLYQSEHFYGTGESFLFTFYPKFKIFKWTGENNFFIKGSAESLGIGCGDGIHGLWFDGDLYHGHSKKCKTYDNDILTTNEDFVIAAIEIWTFLD